MTEEPDIDEYVDDFENDTPCDACSGTGQHYEGDVVVGETCPICGGSG